MRNWNNIKTELLQDKVVQKEYDRLSPRYEAISQLISARLEKGITQKELAQKVGTKQSAIARFEAGNVNPSLDFLERVAGVMGYKVRVGLVK
mgnify:FL=1